MSHRPCLDSDKAEDGTPLVNKCLQGYVIFKLVNCVYKGLLDFPLVKGSFRRALLTFTRWVPFGSHGMSLEPF